jgi:hypothetical protein
MTVKLTVEVWGCQSTDGIRQVATVNGEHLIRFKRKFQTVVLIFPTEQVNSGPNRVIQCAFMVAMMAPFPDITIICEEQAGSPANWLNTLPPVTVKPSDWLLWSR